MKKFSNILLTIFSVGVLGALFAGVLAFAGYLVAMVIGGERAVVLCTYIFKSGYPWVIRICSVCVGCGLVGMYLNKVQALSLSADKHPK